MTVTERLSYVALTAISGIGSATIFRISDTLRKHEVEWDNFWVLRRSNLLKLGLSVRLIDSIFEFRKEHTIYTYQKSLNLRKIRTVLKTDSEYPPLLKKCQFSPVVFFAKGPRIAWPKQPAIAVVGTRQITSYGKLVTEKIVRELSHFGCPIISGWMYGVDVTAHQAALAVGGKTIGVLGYGFNHCYPAHQENLMQEMLVQGMTFLSPFAPHLRPTVGTFPARNRVVAGMSDAVVITEAAEKSGSLITAGYAADEGRLVCAVPGSITSPYSAGTKALLNQGAVLVNSGAEVIQELLGESVDLRPLTSHSVHFSAEENQVILQLKTQPMNRNQLLGATSFSYSQLSLLLTRLELLGSIEKNAGVWSLRRLD